ncbi:MAG: hypothetical protein ACYTFY_06225 [Planctomycetota bacterium]
MNSRLTMLLASLTITLCISAGHAAEKKSNYWKEIRKRANAKRTVPATAPVISYKRFAIEYAVSDTYSSGVGLQKVELYITDDMGLSWKKYGEDPDRRSPFVITVEKDGVYGFALVSTDSVGNRERPPFTGMIPARVIVVDSEKPTGKFISPVKKEDLKGESISISWETEDKYPAQNPVVLQYSADKGKNWRTLKSKLPAKAKVAWIPPQQKSPTYTFRLIVKDKAGNKAEIDTDGIIITDIEPPKAKITGPEQTEGQMVDIEYEAVDNFGGSGLAAVELWITSDNGKSWDRHSTDKDLVSPVKFINKENLGEVGFRLKAIDKVGNSSTPVIPGTKPEISLVFDVEGPEINIISMAKGRRFIKGGSTVAIEWEAVDPNLEENSVELAWSADGGQTWEYIQKGLPGKSSIDWKVPAYTDKNMNNCLIKISAVDNVGNASTAVTEQPFTIVASPLETELGVVTAAPEEAKEVKTTKEVKEEAEKRSRRRGLFSLFGRNRKKEVVEKEAKEEIETVITTPEEEITQPAEEITKPEEKKEPAKEIETFRHPSELDTEGTRAAAIQPEKKPEEESIINIRPENITPKEKTTQEPVKAPAEELKKEVEKTPAAEPKKEIISIKEEPKAIEKTKDPVTEVEKKAAEAAAAIPPAKEPKKALTVEEMLKEAEKDLAKEKEIARKEKITKTPDNAAAEAAARAEEAAKAEAAAKLAAEKEAAMKAAEAKRVAAARKAAELEAERKRLERAEEEKIAKTNAALKKPEVTAVERTPAKAEDTQAMQLIREAELAIEDREYLQARLRATEALELDGKLSRGYLILGLVEANEGNLEKASVLVEKSIGLDNKDASAFMIMGDLSFTQAKEFQKNYDRGRSREVRALESDLKPIREKIALNMRNALRSYATAARLKPDTKEPYSKLGEVYYFQAKNTEDNALKVSAYRDSAEQFELAYNKGKTTYKEAFHLGIIHFRLNELDSAVRYLKRGVEVCPADRKPKECYWYLSEIATRRNHLDDALSYWRITAKAYATDNPRDRKYRKMALERARKIEQQLNNY